MSKLSIRVFSRQVSLAPLTPQPHAYEFAQVRTCVAVKQLPMGTDVEIELTAHL